MVKILRLDNIVLLTWSSSSKAFSMWSSNKFESVLNSISLIFAEVCLMKLRANLLSNYAPESSSYYKIFLKQTSFKHLLNYSFTAIYRWLLWDSGVRKRCSLWFYNKIRMCKYKLNLLAVKNIE